MAMSAGTKDNGTLRLGLPKGRMQQGVMTLLAEAGIEVRASARDYRPTVSVPWLGAKILKPQNIIEMLAAGSRDVGFAGADWVAELDADLVELVDTGLDRVRLVAAAPGATLVGGKLPARGLVVASEYERLTRKWIEEAGLKATFVRSYGATEVFAPDDADCIVDIAASGATLEANRLDVVAELMTSSTRLYANRRAMEDAGKRKAAETLVMLLSSVLEARRRVMLEVNVPAERLEAVCAALPCMREPTISPLHGGAGFAVKAAVPRDLLPSVIPELKARGGTDIVVSGVGQIVP
jgi:ATP phosphoribosyltransferase